MGRNHCLITLTCSKRGADSRLLHDCQNVVVSGSPAGASPGIRHLSLEVETRGTSGTYLRRARAEANGAPFGSPFHWPPLESRASEDHTELLCVRSSWKGWVRGGVSIEGILYVGTLRPDEAISIRIRARLTGDIPAV